MPKTKRPEKVQYQLRLTQDMIDELNERSAETDISVAQIVRTAIAEHLAKKK